MTQQIAYLEAIIGADITSFRRGMAEVRRETGMLSDTVGKIGTLGRQMTFALTAPLLAFGGAAVKAAADFEAEMRNVASISQTVAADLGMFSEMIREIGETTRAGPTEAARAFYEVFSAGIEDTAKAQEILTAAVFMSEAGLSDLSDTTKVLVATMNAYSSSGLEATHASDVWLRMVQLGVGELENFAGAAKFIIPTFSALKIPLEEGASLWARYTQTGTDAGTAARGISMAISNLIKPSEKMVAIFDKIGVANFDELLAETGSITEAFIAVREATEGSSEVIGAFSQRGGRAFLSITEDIDGLRRANELFLGGIEGATMTAHVEQMKGLTAQTDLLKSAFQSFMITVGNALLPVVTPLVTKLRELFLAAGDLSPEVIQMAVVFGALVAAAGPALWLFASLASPVALVGAAIAALVLDVGGLRTKLIGMIPPEVKTALSNVVTLIENITGALSAPEVPVTVFPDVTKMLPQPADVPLLKLINFTIEPGDTPGEIAENLAVTIQEILTATGAEDVYTMPVGEFELNTAKTEIDFFAINDFVKGELISEKELFRKTMADGISDPLTSGIGDALVLVNEAVSGSPELQVLFQSFVIAIGILSKGIEAVLGSVQAGVEGFLKAFTNLDTEGVSTALGAIGIAVSSIVSAAFVIGASILEHTLPAIGDVIVSFLNIFGAVARGDLDAVGRSIEGFIASLTHIPMGIANGLLAALNTIEGINVADVETGLQGWRDAINSIPLVFDGLGKAISGMWSKLLLQTSIGLNQLKIRILTGLSEIVTGLKPLTDALGIELPDIQFDLNQTKVNLDNEKLELLLGEQLTAGSLTSNIQMPLTGLGFDFEGSLLPGDATLWDVLSNDMLRGSIDAGMIDTLIAGVQQEIATALENEQGMDAAIGDGILGLFGIRSEDVAVGGTTTGTAFTEAIGTVFTTAFGEGGTIPTLWDNAWASLKGAVVDETVDMVLSIGGVETALATLAGKIASVKGSIEDLQSMHIPSSGGSSAPMKQMAGGGHLNAGQSALIGEQGPEIFTASRSGFVLPNSVMQGGGNGGGGSTVVNVNGVQNVDAMLYELRRRGVAIA